MPLKERPRGADQNRTGERVTSALERAPPGKEQALTAPAERVRRRESNPRNVPYEALADSRRRTPSEQMPLSIGSCRESLEPSPRSASRRSPQGKSAFPSIALIFTRHQ